jgi:Rieske Fe-S protein
MSHPWRTSPNPRATDNEPEQEQTHSPPPITGRRAFLRWAIHGLGVILSVILGAPAVAYLLTPLRGAVARGAGADSGNFTDVASLGELPMGVPREFIVKETRQDAWTLLPDQLVGRVFLLRERGAGGQDDIKAFTTTCPHLGCSVNFTGNTSPQGVAFLCPCHGGRFNIDGQRVDLAQNVAPRNMDTLAVRRKPGEPDIIQIQYKSFRPNNPDRVEVK